MFFLIFSPNFILRIILALLNGNLLTEVWNVRFHQFFGGFLFTDCVPKPKSKSEPDINCCGEYPARNPFDRNNAICCDGEINDEGRCVGSSFNKKRKRRSLIPGQKSAFWPQMTMSQKFLRDQKKLQQQDCYQHTYIRNMPYIIGCILEIVTVSISW